MSGPQAVTVTFGARPDTRTLFASSSFKWTIALWFFEPTQTPNAGLVDLRLLDGWETYRSASGASLAQCTKVIGGVWTGDGCALP